MLFHSFSTWEITPKYKNPTIGKQVCGKYDKDQVMDHRSIDQRKRNESAESIYPWRVPVFQIYGCSWTSSWDASTSGWRRKSPSWRSFRIFFEGEPSSSSITANLSTSWPEAYSSDTRSKNKSNASRFSLWSVSLFYPATAINDLYRACFCFMYSRFEKVQFNVVLFATRIFDIFRR